MNGVAVATKHQSHRSRPDIRRRSRPIRADRRSSPDSTRAVPAICSMRWTTHQRGRRGTQGPNLVPGVRSRPTTKSEQYGLDYVDYVSHVALSRARSDRRGSDRSARRAPESMFKLMAYKDEYEVARLCVEPGFESALHKAFGPDATYRYQPASAAAPRRASATRRSSRSVVVPSRFSSHYGSFRRVQRKLPSTPFGRTESASSGETTHQGTTPLWSGRTSLATFDPLRIAIAVSRPSPSPAGDPGATRKSSSGASLSTRRKPRLRRCRGCPETTSSRGLQMRNLVIAAIQTQARHQ